MSTNNNVNGINFKIEIKINTFWETNNYRNV